VKLIPISEHPDHAKILYQLLEEREAHVNISHRWMPTWEKHLEHIKIHAPHPMGSAGWGPYSHKDWCIIVDDDTPVGAIYLSNRNELGPGILKARQRRGYGEAACRAMMAKHGPRLYVWNANPQNAASIALAEKLGFKLIQVTYALEAK
jgi:RimJ/RimL family protein N-acetyltransferase